VKVVIAGSREISDVRLVAEAVRRSGFQVSTVISGGARGVDRAGEAWARAQHLPMQRFPADWARYGRSAGIRRNDQMIAHIQQHGGAVIAVWNGVSPGTRHTIESARRQGIPVFVLRVDTQ
jgi:hypothetical protein